MLYAPGLRDAAEVAAVCRAVDRPVNVLAHPGLTLAEVVEAGAQRVSVGGGLAWAAVSGLVAAAEELRDGRFGSLVAPAELGEWLGSAA